MVVSGDEKEVTAQEAADQLGYHMNHVYRLQAQGKIKGRKLLGRVWLFPQSEVNRLRALQEKHGRLPRSDRA